MKQWKQSKRRFIVLPPLARGPRRPQLRTVVDTAERTPLRVRNPVSETGSHTLRASGLYLDTLLIRGYLRLLTALDTGGDRQWERRKTSPRILGRIVPTTLILDSRHSRSIWVS